MIWRRNRDKSNREICRLGKETQSKITHDEDGALIGFGDVKGISCQGKAGFDAIGSHDYGRELSVATVISCVKIALFHLGGKPRTRSDSLSIDNYQGNLSHAGKADTFLHEGKAG